MYRTVAQLDSLTQLLASWFPAYFTRILLPEPSVRAPGPNAEVCCSSAARMRASS